MARHTTLVLIHVLGCLIFLALPYLFADEGFARLAELPHNPHEQRNLLSYLLTIGFFYLNAYVLIPRFYFTRQYVGYGVCVLVCFLLIQSLLTTVNRQGNRPPFGPANERLLPPPPFPNQGPPRGLQPPGLPPENSQTFFLFLAGLLLSLAIGINNRWRETERQRLNTELSYLKAQINPHFLFNTLNSIYSLAIVESPATANALIQLSSFLRYVISEGHQDRVSLPHELAYIGHYVALQRLRLSDTVPIQYTTLGNPNGLHIAPLLLISFIENAFKYGISPQEPSRIDIRIEIRENQLSCYVFNQKVWVAESTAASSGIGLTNTKARLQLLYPGQHTLVIRDVPNSFTVELSLTLS
ncbi:sensor histidine kinase [Spirosoma fluminis]